MENGPERRTDWRIPHSKAITILAMQGQWWLGLGKEQWAWREVSSLRDFFNALSEKDMVIRCEGRPPGSLAAALWACWTLS